MTQKALLQAAGDGTAAPAGSVGEVKFLSTSTSTAAVTVPGNSLTITAGIWILYGQVQIESTGPTKARLDIEVQSGGTVLGMPLSIASYAGGDVSTIARLNCGGLVVSVPASAQIRTVVYQTVSASATITQVIEAIRIA